MISLITKQHCVKVKKLEARIERISIIALKASTTTLYAFIPSSSSKDKTIDEDIIEELMRDMKELKVEMNSLKNNTKLVVN